MKKKIIKKIIRKRSQTANNEFEMITIKKNLNGEDEEHHQSI